MLTENQDIKSKERLEKITKRLGEHPGVTVPPARATSRTSGSPGIRKNNKVFTMVSLKDRLIVKLPRERVKELVTHGVGEPFDPDQGWLMREWFVVDPAYYEKWLSLAM
jgi:hypothetical protein